MRHSRFRRALHAGLPLLLILFAVAAYFFIPALRLPGSASRLHATPVLHAVDAHHYDQEWFDAARAGRIDILSALYAAHYPIDSQTHAGFSALILAAYDEQPEALNYLLDAGANPCLGDNNGNTALMGALYKGELAIARRLLNTRCKIDQTNHAGATALTFAALFGRLDILPALMAKGADLEHADARGDTPLQIALKQGNTEVATALRKLGATR